MIHRETKNDYHSKKAKNTDKKPIKIYKNLDQTHNVKLSDMGLLELSNSFGAYYAQIPKDIFKELKRRIKLIQTYLETGETDMALKIVNGLLKNP
ncbi:MAG: hypothetical protein LBV17_04010 [Treponema sp.]|jgi:hypothetical protein|nr:hypothetical protein [Treponema sp.]